MDQQQSGVRENKETVVHESLEGEGFEGMLFKDKEFEFLLINNHLLLCSILH